jgi:hypothetical protein
MNAIIANLKDASKTFAYFFIKPSTWEKLGFFIAGIFFAKGEFIWMVVVLMATPIIITIYELALRAKDAHDD